MPVTIGYTGAGLTAQHFAQVTVGAVAVGLTIPGGATPHRAVLSVQGQPIRYRYDGVDPTSSVGHLAAAGSELELIGATRISQFHMIRQGTDATVAYTIEV